MASEALRLYGTDEPVAPVRELRAGALAVELQGARLKRIRCDGREVWHGLAFVLRDPDWGTPEPQIERVELQRVARGHHAHRRLGGVHHGDVADPVLEHQVQGVAEGLVLGERQRVVRHHLAHRGGVGVEAGGDHAEGGIALGEDAGEHAVLGDQRRAAVQRLHALGHLTHRGEDRYVDEGTAGENLMDRTAGHDLSPFAFMERHG